MDTRLDTPELEAEVRGLNARIARDYDAIPTNIEVARGAEPEWVLALAALHGCARSGGDLLDLGCGTGGLLQRAGDIMDGRLVGVDLSAASCAAAREACAPLGPRASIIEGDFLDLDPDRLGRFDMVYLLGVLYVVPPAVRRHLLSLIAACLKPGGVAVISYYTGARGLIRAALSRQVQALDDSAASMASRVAAARRRIGIIARQAEKLGAAADLARNVISRVGRTSDAVLYHEIIAAPFEAIDTRELAAGLATGGLAFLNFLGRTALPFDGAPVERALAASDLDFAGGGYRYAVFAKADPADTALCPRAGGVRWHGDIVPGLDAAGAGQTFRVGDGEMILSPRTPIAAITLRELASGPRSWQELEAAAVRELGQQAAEASLGRLERDLIDMWQAGAVFPKLA